MKIRKKRIIYLATPLTHLSHTKWFRLAHPFEYYTSQRLAHALVQNHDDKKHHMTQERTEHR